MTNKLEIFKCPVCGNIVQVLNEGEGELVCCGKPMELLVPKTQDIGEEKHVPVFSKDKNGNHIVKVGAESHPMTDEHYIMFVEAISKDKNKFAFEYLYPDMKPEMAVNNDFEKAIEYCNIHGLWEGNNIND